MSYSDKINEVGEEKKLPSKNEMQFGICIERIAKKFIFS
jgi:hypothetical protein